MTNHLLKSIPSITALVSAVALICGSGLAQAEPVTRIDLVCPETIVAVGETFPVQIVLTAASGSAVKSATARLTFGADLELVAPASAGDACPRDGFVSCGGPTGSVTCACLSQGRIAEGAIVSARVRLRSCPAAPRVRIDRPQALDPANRVVDTVAGDGCTIACQ